MQWSVLCELMDRAKSGEAALRTSGEEGQSLEAVRSGMYLRKEGCGNFWDDFISVCGNSDALSDLLDVPKEKITGWPSKIRDLMDQIEKMDNNEEGDEKRGMVPTGESPTAGPDNNQDVNPDFKPYPS